jgi:hypothetical protein
VDNTRTLKEILNDTPAKPPKDELTAAFDHPHVAQAKLQAACEKTGAGGEKAEHPAKSLPPPTATSRCWLR